MNIAWLTHREWGQSGGAEMCDYDMAMRRPDGVKLTVMFPGGVTDDLPDFDRVVVTGWYGFSRRELNLIQDVAHKTTLWVHDEQMKGHWLYEVASNIIMASPAHAKNDLEGVTIRGKVHVNPGWMDIDEIFDIAAEAPRERYMALWAARPVPHKGLDLAAKWSHDNNVPLEVLVGRPREYVLRKMTEREYFVLLPHIFDAAPRTVMEAQLLGCELVINEKVGWFDETQEELAARLTSADKDFWEVVLS